MLATVYTKVLKDAQSKSKQREYGIPKEKFPNYLHDTDDLDYYCIDALIRNAKHVCNGEDLDEEELKLCVDYFDSAINIEKRHVHTNDYLLFASCANFLDSNFGNVKVYVSLVKDGFSQTCRNLHYFLAASVGALENVDYSLVDLRNSIDAYLSSGEDFEKLKSQISGNISRGLACSDVDETLYNILFLSVLIHSKGYLSAFALEKYSDINYESWLSVFKKQKLPTMLWQSQVEIGERGGFKGGNIVIQTPTGSGKTKAIQLILASHFLRNGNKISAIILSPLRSLCDEITNDLNDVFSGIEVTRLSDVIEEDDNLACDGNCVLVMTPEKFEYTFFHDRSFINGIDLLVIDEGHLIEDRSRGPNFELIISELKALGFSKPIVFISAILKNPEQIGEWLFSENGYSLVKNPCIRTTNKNISRLSGNTIDFYDISNLGSRQYYVANSIRKCELNPFPGERKRRFFPNDSAADISIFYMFLLSKNGGVGVFFKNLKSLRSYLRRSAELINRGYDIGFASNAHTEKLKNLIRMHYGEKEELLRSIDAGLGFHYATLEEGVKKSIEYYLRRKYINKVFCTATLSEGVNIPIKYLLITDLNDYTYDIKTREIINLVGRTARNGEYSEGTILVTAKCDDQKFARLFDESGIEPLNSAMNILVEDKVALGSSLSFPVFNHVVNFLGSNGNSFESFDNYAEAVFDNYWAKNHPGKNEQWPKNQLRKYCTQISSCLDSLELYISNYVLMHESDACDDFSCDVLEKTYLYFISDGTRKDRLKRICALIHSRASEKIEKSRQRYAKYPFANLTTIDRLINWNDQNRHLLNSCIDEYLSRLIDLLFDGRDNIDALEKAFSMWINGRVFVDIAKECSLKIEEVEKICREDFSFKVSNNVGNLMDILGDEESALLRVYQKRIKYGLSSEDAIKIYELGICDRYLAEFYTSHNTPEMEDELKRYPEIFSKRFSSIKAKLQDEHL